MFASIFSVESTAKAGFLVSFTGSTGNASADAGFQLAANFLQSTFSDNITVTIQRGFAALIPGILGQTSSTTQEFTYTSFRNGIITDVKSGSDAVFATVLPAGSSFVVYMNRTSNNGNTATPYIDTTGLNTTRVNLNTANAKALGLTSFAGTDASITFSSSFTWDFDNTDGISPGSQDFVGVTIHEMMHGMGFTSGVDRLDFNPGLSDNSFRVSGLDFTRHSTDSVANGADVDVIGWDLAAVPEPNSSVLLSIAFGVTGFYRPTRKRFSNI